MKPSNGVPSAAEFGELRAFLALQGVKQSDINLFLGGSPAGRTRAEITEHLREMISTFSEPEVQP